MVFSTNTDVNRFVMNNTGKNAFSFVLHPNAGWILGPTNITFMHGQVRGAGLRRVSGRMHARHHTD